MVPALAPLHLSGGEFVGGPVGGSGLGWLPYLGCTASGFPGHTTPGHTLKTDRDCDDLLRLLVASGSGACERASPILLDLVQARDFSALYCVCSLLPTQGPRVMSAYCEHWEPYCSSSLMVASWLALHVRVDSDHWTWLPYFVPKTPKDETGNAGRTFKLSSQHLAVYLNAGLDSHDVLALILEV